MRATALILLVSAWGCVVEPGASPARTVRVDGALPDGTGWVDWHTGTPTVGIFMGPQGGQHVWVSVTTSTEFYTKKARLSVGMTDLDTGEEVKPGVFQFVKELLPEGEGLRAAAVTAFVKEPCKIKGHRVLVRVAVEDLVGLTGTGESIIRPTWDGFCTE